MAPLMAIEPSTHEFLGSKKSEILLEESLQQQRTGSSSSTSGSAFGRTSPQMLSFSTGTQVWNLQLADHSTNISLINDISCCTLLAAAEDRDQDQAAHERSKLKLDLNMTAGAGAAGSPSRTPREQEQSVCNMEMVQRALRLSTDHPAAPHQQPDHQCRKSRDQPFPIAAGNAAQPKLSGSPAALSSSLTAASTRGSDPAAAAWSSHGGSPSTSSSTSSTTSSRSRQQQLDHGNQAVQLAVAADSSHTGRQPAAAATPYVQLHNLNLL